MASNDGIFNWSMLIGASSLIVAVATAFHVKDYGVDIDHSPSKKIIAARYFKAQLEEAGSGVAELYLSKMPENKELMKKMDSLAVELAKMVYEARNMETVVKLPEDTLKLVLLTRETDMSKLLKLPIDSIKLKKDPKVPPYNSVWHFLFEISAPITIIAFLCALCAVTD